MNNDQPGRGEPEREQQAEPGKPDDVTPLSVLERARARDPDAWRRLVALYQPLVEFWCGRAGLRGPDVEDVAQEVFAAVAANLSGFHRDHPGDTFRGWLRAITRNGVLLHFRRSQGKTQAAGGSAALQQLRDAPDPLAGVEEEEQAKLTEVYRQALEQVRGAFEERTWLAFWRTVIDGQSPVTLAAELSMTTASIRQAKSRVLRRLRRELGDLLE
jgi:RNA polymerase sigma-70 factor (ECF subfamily)